MPIRIRSNIVLVGLALTLAAGAMSCSKSDGSDPESTGPIAQAVERLAGFGLSDDEAECIVDEVGAQSVVEATDLTAYTDSQQYQDAATACIDDA